MAQDVVNDLCTDKVGLVIKCFFVSGFPFQTGSRFFILGANSILSFVSPAQLAAIVLSSVCV